MQSFYGSKEKQGRSSGRKDRVRGSLSPCGPTYYSPGVGLYDHFGDPRDYADETLDDQETHAETFQSPSGASSDRTRTPIATGQSSCYQLLDARRTQETRLPLVHSRVTNDPQSNSQHHQIIQQENQIPSSSDGSTPTGTGGVENWTEDRSSRVSELEEAAFLVSAVHPTAGSMNFGQ